ncbi:hypothetical protein JMUB7540_28430 [Staphylococcus aureus]
MTSDAVVQPGSSGSPILNSKREAIGVMYASDKTTGESTRSVSYTHLTLPTILLV